MVRTTRTAGQRLGWQWTGSDRPRVTRRRRELKKRRKLGGEHARWHRARGGDVVQHQLRHQDCYGILRQRTMADQRRAPALPTSALGHHREAQSRHLRPQRVAEDGRRDAAGASGAVRVGTSERGRALATGDYMPEVRRRLLAAWVAWGARLRRGPGAPLTRRGVSPTL